LWSGFSILGLTDPRVDWYADPGLWDNCCTVLMIVHPLREFGGIRFTGLGVLDQATIHHSMVQQLSQRSAYSVVQENPVD